MRALLISIAFPPKGDPECIQTGRYFKGLSEKENITVDVVTSSNPTLFMPMDPTLDKYARVKGQLIELPIFESKYTNFFLRKVAPGLLSKPDSKMTFHWQWRRVVNQLKTPPDIIYSRSYPLSSTLMGYKLKKYFQVPWVLHLSDPWTENALHSYTQEELMYHSHMEFKCFQAASVISFTSDKTLNLYQKKYPDFAGKMIVFPNISDTGIFINNPPKATSLRGKIRIVYTGGLANTRMASAFLSAMAHLYKMNVAISEKLEVIFAGDMDRRNQGFFKQFALPFVTHVGLISSERALELQKSADLLLVIDSEIEDKAKAVFFPSKLLDYGMLQIPIMAITDKGSETESFVVNQGGICFHHGEVERMADWINLFANREIQLKMKPLASTFLTDFQTQRLMSTFNKLV